MLVLWIPGTKDYKNYGIGDIDVQCNLPSVVLQNGGKIGENYLVLNRQDSQEYSYLYWDKKVINSTSFTISTWVFTSGSDNKCLMCCRNAANKGFAMYFIGLSLRIDTGTNWSTGYSITAGEWTHITFVSDGNQQKLYVNGVKTASRTATADISTVTDLVTIGREHVNGTVNNSSVRLTGGINDFRIYDEALSPRQIKELSKGLVRHYPLSRLSTNFVDTTKSFPVSSGKVIAIKDGVRTLGVDADTYFNIPLNQTLIANTTYTLSFYASEVKEGATLRFGLGAQSTTSGNHCGIVDVKTGYNTHTFTPSVNISTQIIMDDTQRLGLPIVEMTHFKIEEGSIATPWIPSPADLRFTKIYGLTSETIYDTSGFGNNGSINGHPTSYSGSARYSGSIGNFTNSKYITAPSLPSNTKTISFWVKSGTISGSQVVFADYGSKIAFGFNGNNTTYIVCDLPSGSGYSTGSRCVAGGHWKENDWNHFVIIKLTDSPYTFKTYLNGNLLSASSTNYWAHTIDDLMIGRRSSGSPFGGQISDFRAYVTELSEDDILELYHTPISLTKQGTLMTQGEYVEVM